YAATGEHSVALHQVHETDGGRIRYRKVCSIDGEEVPADQIVKGYETDDGRMVVLTDEDLGSLPLRTDREIAVEGFVPEDQVDPISLGRTYYLEPDGAAVKPYTLLREALATTERVALVTVALRQRESMAVLRVRGDVICLQTLLWPDEVRAAEFGVLDTEVSLKPAERTMAASLVESMAMDLDPSQFEDHYASALEAVIAEEEGNRAAGERGPVAVAAEIGCDDHLLAALHRSL
ncbi:MAG TPA: Ku protein, partial [Actinotalea sp.]|nr:Ku protein [Actinotalea sp.]